MYTAEDDNNETRNEKNKGCATVGPKTMQVETGRKLA